MLGAGAIVACGLVYCSGGLVCKQCLCWVLGLLCV